MAEGLLTPEFRVSFPNVFKPAKPMPPATEGKFSVTMLFKKGENIDALKALAENALKAKWGPDATKWPKGWRNPFKDQGEKSYEGYEEGCVFITASANRRPGIVDHKVQDIIDDSQIYPGCYARAYVTAYAYGGPGTTFTPGVAFGLQHIQKLRDGDPLGGRTRPTDVFEPVGGSETGLSADSVFGG